MSKKSEAVKRNRHAKAQYVRDIKEASPCCDCNTFYPSYVMQFDHRSDKKFGLAQVTRTNISIKRIDVEIAKCDLVCANCHALRTHKRRVLSLQED